MNYTENNQETTEKPWLPRDYPPAQLKRSEREPSKGHCGPRWYGAAGKHNSWCSIFREASPGSISLEDSVVNNRQCLQWGCKVSALVHHTPQHTSAEPCKWANRGAEDVKFHSLFYKKLWDRPVPRTVKDDPHKVFSSFFSWWLLFWIIIIIVIIIAANKT